MNTLPCPRRFSVRATFAAAIVLAVVGLGLVGVHANETPTTGRSEDPADAVLDRLLPGNQSPATRDARPNGDFNPGDFAGALDVTSGPAAIAPDVRPQRLLREGTFVIDRPGRVRRVDSGELEFLFRADGSTSASAGDPPMLLVPNLNLMAVESAVRRNPEQAFRVTGRVTEYRGRNHLILEKVVLIN